MVFYLSHALLFLSFFSSLTCVFVWIKRTIFGIHLLQYTSLHSDLVVPLGIRYIPSLLRVTTVPLDMGDMGYKKLNTCLIECALYTYLSLGRFSIVLKPIISLLTDPCILFLLLRASQPLKSLFCPHACVHAAPSARTIVSPSFCREDSAPQVP